MRRDADARYRTGFRDGGYKPGMKAGGWPNLDPVDVDEAGSRPSRPHGEPERALMRAVLEDAVTRYRQRAIKTGKTTSMAWRQTQAEAVAWFMPGASKHWFSFENICDVLGLDAEYIRKKLANESARGVGQLHRYPACRQGARGSTGRMVGRVSG